MRHDFHIGPFAQTWLMTLTILMIGTSVVAYISAVNSSGLASAPAAVARAPLGGD